MSNNATEDLTCDTITFGKYKDLTLSEMLRDRKYCGWLVQQEWFEQQYEFLYNRVLEHCPREYFVNLEHLAIEDNLDLTFEEFLESYEFFNLIKPQDLKIDLADEEKLSYSYYLGMIDSLRQRMLRRQQKGEPNVYDIKAPNGWLKKLEKLHDIPRAKFKEFLMAHDLPNIPYIIQDIKQMGGLVYNGARSYLIAKERSVAQELFWEEKLKEKYGEDVGTQFKYNHCIFDMINIGSRTLYECKLGLKDFNEDQHRKYLVTLGTRYTIIYLIGTDCVINMNDQKLYTTELGKYYAYILKIPKLKKPSKFDTILKDYEVEEVNDILVYI
jgi:hypothetical protein